MNLRRWGIGAAFLTAVVVGGCQKSATEKVEEAREDAVEAEQEARVEQAELRQAECQAKTEQPTDGGGPILTLPPTTEAETAPATSEGGSGQPDSADPPNEGDPQSPGGTDSGSAGDAAGSAEAPPAAPE